VQTKVRPFSWDLVKEALEKELARGGQAFFVHNNISELPRLTDKIRQLLPEAEVAFIHAQMPARQVEDTLLSFIYQQIAVLVTTNLVESGLDIPNANTIIVNQAHRFGLSDLHQLRGRVGRGGRQAYCYLLVPGLYHLSPDALRRLEALEEFSDLGSGFQIAMRDLEIRGAGDFFGREQSGFIADIGYDLYQKFLEEAIAQLKEEEGLGLDDSLSLSPLAECVVESDWKAYVPQTWIPYPATRLEIYHRFSQTRDETDLQALLRELLDRFGSLPPEVLTLADIIRLRWIGDKLQSPYIRVRKGKARWSLGPETPLASLIAYLESLRPQHAFRLSPE
jgi:transcription-repair coupling factor (superfamily II helicase)